ncbi:hypothetical protein ATANTOWER_022402 [Ataeniobius toweri]|uniref:Uncharacterized protein n=1 Tax=Ataeniobius toweri TaxID=208326 RepID=A0ABU7A7N0_9TELE|nr:hypothetical protein [Ataeniobius toweri]
MMDNKRQNPARAALCYERDQVRTAHIRPRTLPTGAPQSQQRFSSMNLIRRVQFNVDWTFHYRGCPCESYIYIYSALRKYSAPLNQTTFCHISGLKFKFFVKNQQQVGHNREVE